MPAHAAHSAQDKARLERMIHNDYRFVWRLLRRLGLDSQHADDAVQQVFLIAAERLADIRAGSERSFAYGTALRVAQSVKRRKGRESLPIEESQPSALPGPDELSDQQRARERLDRVLDAMPMELRTVFVLFELEQLTSPEIAKMCELPLGTVASRLRRARELFHELVAHQVQPGAARSAR